MHDANVDPSVDNLFAFFERLKTMSSIQRFGTLPMIQSESVAAHSFNVAIMSLLIADYEEDLKIDHALLMRKALFHDFEETILSDIPHPIKHRYQGGRLGKLLEEIVEAVLDNDAFHELPEAMERRYARDAKEAKWGAEGEIVAAADAMDLVLTATREIKLGNRYFDHVFDAGMELCEKFRHFRLVDEFCGVAREYLEKGQFVDGIFHENRRDADQMDLFA